MLLLKQSNYLIHQLAFVDIIRRGLMRHQERLVEHTHLPPKSPSECRNADYGW